MSISLWSREEKKAKKKLIDIKDIATDEGQRWSS